MKTIKHTLLSALLLASFGMPALASAHTLTGEYYARGGHFYFINHVSRRTLRESIVKTESLWVPTEIV